MEVSVDVVSVTLGEECARCVEGGGSSGYRALGLYGSCKIYHEGVRCPFEEGQDGRSFETKVKGVEQYE